MFVLFFFAGCFAQKNFTVNFLENWKEFFNGFEVYYDYYLAPGNCMEKGGVFKENEDGLALVIKKDPYEDDYIKYKMTPLPMIETSRYGLYTFNFSMVCKKSSSFLIHFFSQRSYASQSSVRFSFVFECSKKDRIGITYYFNRYNEKTHDMDVIEKYDELLLDEDWKGDRTLENLFVEWREDFILMKYKNSVYKSDFIKDQLSQKEIDTIHLVYAMFYERGFSLKKRKSPKFILSSLEYNSF